MLAFVGFGPPPLTRPTRNDGFAEYPLRKLGHALFGYTERLAAGEAAHMDADNDDGNGRARFFEDAAAIGDLDTGVLASAEPHCEHWTYADDLVTCGWGEVVILTGSANLVLTPGDARKLADALLRVADATRSHGAEPESRAGSEQRMATGARLSTVMGEIAQRLHEEGVTNGGQA